MLESVAALQPVVIGALLLWAGAWKTFVPSARRLAQRTALASFLRVGWLVRAAFQGVGIGELITGSLLLIPQTLGGWSMRLAAVMCAGFLGYLVLAWRFAPDLPCGCLNAKPLPVSQRSLMRAGLLLALALLGLTARQSWLSALRAAPWLGIILTLEALVLLLVSPEYDGIGRRWARRLIRRALPADLTDCAAITVAPEAVLARVQASAAYAELAPYLSGAQQDQWRDGCLSYVAYAAEYTERAATAIFAIPVSLDATHVSAALVADADDAVLLRVGGSAVHA